MFAPLRFLWNATRGNRLHPWRSEYLRWRVETYSGMHAETMTTKDILSFVWASALGAACLSLLDRPHGSRSA